MDLTSLIADALAQPKDALLFHLSQSLARAFPDRHLFETDSWAFGLTAFRRDGLCQVRVKPDVHSQLDWDWNSQERHEYREFRTAWLEISWQDKTLEAIVVSHEGAYRTEHRWYLLADSESLNREFFRAVAEHTAEVRGEVLVFDGGCWQKSKELFESIQTASWDNLILEGNLKTEIREDLEGFFNAEDTYRRYGIPWKRGVLFLGPPGNGKTHTVKAIVGSIGRPCLYVKSLKSDHQTDHDLIGEVFRRARVTAPCILVFEDLDALIDDENRSFFLNELDGFASNDGIVSIATTNHPEKLDPAILERPSRFDRKYTFDLPQASERAEYLQLFAAKLEPDLQMDEEGYREVAEATDGYSFAYLKELYLSAMMKWIAKPGAVPISALMTEQCEALRAQMATDPGDSDVPRPNHFDARKRAMAQYMRRWKQ